ncbi:MAG: hypothetical protein SWJ54_24815, partial [Cyanobacteriota bacterium]|nr:hypothetical protein [Cyanobacteriota bacterium]
MISKEMIQNIIRSEVQTSSKKWVRFSRLAGILSQHGIEIEAEYFYNNPDFRIYRTENINIFLFHSLSISLNVRKNIVLLKEEIINLNQS